MLDIKRAITCVITLSLFHLGKAVYEFGSINNCVSYNNKMYASLTDRPVTYNPGFFCGEQGAVPSGWVVSPTDSDSSAVGGIFPWAYGLITVGHPFLVYVGGSTYKIREGCNCRILIMCKSY